MWAIYVVYSSYTTDDCFDCMPKFRRTAAGKIGCTAVLVDASLFSRPRELNAGSGCVKTSCRNTWIQGSDGPGP